MQFYFVMYSPGVSTMMHKLSLVNIKYILSIGDLFNEDDMAVLTQIGTYQDLYNEDFDYFQKKVFVVDTQEEEDQAHRPQMKSKLVTKDNIDLAILEAKMTIFEGNV